MSTEQYYTRVLGDIDGPFTMEELSVLVRKGKLGRMHEVSTDRTQWKQAEQLAELFLVITPNIAALVKPAAAPVRPAQKPDTGRVNEVPGLHPPNHPSSRAAPRPAQPQSEYALTPPSLVQSAGQPPPRPSESSDAPAADSVAQSDAAGTLWYYTVSGEAFGPVEKREIDELIQTGTALVDMVWTKGMSSWTPVGEIPQLFPPRPRPPLPRSSPDDGADTRRRPSRLSEMAVASLILSLAPLGGLNCPLAFVFALIAMKQIQESKGHVWGLPFAILGMVISFLSLFAWLLFYVNVLR